MLVLMMIMLSLHVFLPTPHLPPPPSPTHPVVSDVAGGEPVSDLRGGL